MDDGDLNRLVNEIYDPRIEECDAEYRREMTRLYIKLALVEGIEIGSRDFLDYLEGYKRYKGIGV